MDNRNMYSSEFTFFADADGTFNQHAGPSDYPEHVAASASSDALRRPSLFSNGPTASRPLHTAASSPHLGQDAGMTSETNLAATSTPQPLSTLAGRQSPETHAEAIDDMSSSIHRPRIPRVEKDADDPSTPVQGRDAFPQPNSTPTTLNRLFAVNATLPESRSTSFNAPVEFKPRSLAAEPASLAGHLYTQGLLSGKHSDITVNAFGCSYRLHRLMLARAPFFGTALSGQWIESTSKDITLHPEDIDSNITQVCFELALKRLYGASVPQEEASEAIGLFATGCWLEMHDLIDSSIEAMLRHMTPGTLSPLIKLVTSNYYGRAGDKILASAKAMLCRDGWKMPLKIWDGVPADIVREIVGGDGFFVNGEWDRWVLAKRILNRRLRNAALETGLVVPGTRRILEAPDVAKLMAVRFDTVYRKNYIRTATHLPENAHRWVSLYTHPDIEPLLVLLDEGIHYVHFDYEHLQYIRKATDLFGLPVMPENVISEALWMQLELRQKVLNAHESNMELGLSKPSEDANLQFQTAQDMSILDVTSNKGKKRQSNLSASDEEDIPSNSWDGNGKPRKFWIPSADCNIVMGGNADPVIASSSPSAISRHISRLSGTLQPEDVQWASDFGAASADSRPLPPRPSSAGNAPGPLPEIKPVAFTHFPPFRFAAEFPNPRLLKEKKRVYSRTIFYAGSLWNIYIQKVRSSKNPQLGVYLHRAKERETEEALVSTQGMGQGSVDERIGLLEREMLLRHDRVSAQRRRRRQQLEAEFGTRTVGGAENDDESSASGDVDGPLAATIPRGSSGAGTVQRPRVSDVPYRKSRQLMEMEGKRRSSSSSERDGARRGFYSEGEDDDGEGRYEDEDDEELARLGNEHVPTLPGYVDARPTIKTYFKIYSPSKGGRMLSVYESAPDRFNFSQSWGWKSSTLMLDEGMGGEDDGVLSGGGGYGGLGLGVGEEVPRRNEGRLRFMVVIGNV
ncbi:Germ cell-less protein-like 1 [Elsinoe australis]|uniref:Germ cell-less protein-like 1 n=1 Tax=Elsinoe australis TaxID=40998 RepID=A0A2P7YE27_9PEZI|nr:Germ cell-less protein-like 1 [Elsinoe australis]